jgi:hypothetical protein
MNHESDTSDDDSIPKAIHLITQKKKHDQSSDILNIDSRKLNEDYFSYTYPKTGKAIMINNYEFQIKANVRVRK